MIRTGLLGKLWGSAASGLPVSASAAMPTTNTNLPAASRPMPCAPWRILAKFTPQRSTSQPPTKVACRLHLKWWRCRRIASTARNGSALAGYYLQKPILYSRDIELALFSDAKLEEPNAVTISLNEAVRAAADRVPTCPAAGRQRKPL